MEEMKSGETGAVVATPNKNFSQNVVRNTKKRKQAEITDFFAKKHINKNDLMPQNRLAMSFLKIRLDFHYKTHFFRGLTGSYNKKELYRD